MTKRSDIGLKTLFWTNPCTFLKIAKKWFAQCEKGQIILISGKNAVFYKPVHFAANCKKSSVPSAKLTKRCDLGLNSLFCTNSCSLLKIEKKWCTQSRKDKTFCSGDQNSHLQKVVHFAENAKKWCAQCGTCWSRDESPYCTNPCTLLNIAQKWCAQCENDKTSRSRAENDVLYKLVHFAENRLKVVFPVQK